MFLNRGRVTMCRDYRRKKTEEKNTHDNHARPEEHPSLGSTGDRAVNRKQNSRLDKRVDRLDNYVGRDRTGARATHPRPSQTLLLEIIEDLLASDDDQDGSAAGYTDSCDRANCSRTANGPDSEQRDGRSTPDQALGGRVGSLELAFKCRADLLCEIS
jgi:hypothetical protein